MVKRLAILDQGVILLPREFGEEDVALAACDLSCQSGKALRYRFMR